MADAELVTRKHFLIGAKDAARGPAYVGVRRAGAWGEAGRAGGKAKEVVLWAELCSPQKICSSPNPWYLGISPHLDLGSLQM